MYIYIYIICKIGLWGEHVCSDSGTPAWKGTAHWCQARTLSAGSAPPSRESGERLLALVASGHALQRAVLRLQADSLGNGWRSAFEWSKLDAAPFKR